MHKTSAFPIWYCICVCVCVCVCVCLQLATSHSWHTILVRVAGQSHHCNCCVFISRVFIYIIWQTQGIYQYKDLPPTRFWNISYCNNFTITSYLLLVRRGLSLLLSLWTNILPDDGWSKKPKHLLVTNKINPWATNVIYIYIWSTHSWCF